MMFVDYNMDFLDHLLGEDFFCKGPRDSFSIQQKEVQQW